jgi:hypothetical protein
MAKASAKRSLNVDSNAPSPGHAERLRDMCHHGFITEEQAHEVIERILNGDQTVEDAVEELQNNCPCGLFLPSRARRILNGASKPADTVVNAR